MASVYATLAKAQARLESSLGMDSFMVASGFRKLNHWAGTLQKKIIFAKEMQPQNWSIESKQRSFIKHWENSALPWRLTPHNLTWQAATLEAIEPMNWSSCTWSFANVHAVFAKFWGAKVSTLRTSTHQRHEWPCLCEHLRITEVNFCKQSIHWKWQTPMQTHAAFHYTICEASLRSLNMVTLSIQLGNFGLD